jgi:hypothetical protein
MTGWTLVIYERGEVQKVLPQLEVVQLGLLSQSVFGYSTYPPEYHQALVSCPSCVPEKVGINQKCYSCKIKRFKCK